MEGTGFRYLTEEDQEMLGKSGKCYCGQDGIYTINPYAAEIYGDEILECMCEDCYQNACDDI